MSILAEKQSQLNHLCGQTESLLPQFRDQYVRYHLYPENTAHANAFLETQTALQTLSNDIVHFTKECQREVEAVNAKSVALNRSIEKAKQRKQEARREWTHIQNQQNGSSQRVEDSIALYNRQYSQNIQLGVATLLLVWFTVAR